MFECHDLVRRRHHRRDMGTGRVELHLFSKQITINQQCSGQKCQCLVRSYPWIDGYTYSMYCQIQ